MSRPFRFATLSSPFTPLTQLAEMAEQAKGAQQTRRGLDGG
jgi:hypothetical protein